MICERKTSKIRPAWQFANGMPPETNQFGLRTSLTCWSQWPRGLRRRSAAARLLRLWVRIPPGAWIFVCCEGCVLSGKGLCDELITRPEESYRLRCVVVCDLETSRIKRPRPTLGRSATGGKKTSLTFIRQTVCSSNSVVETDFHST